MDRRAWLQRAGLGASMAGLGTLTAILPRAASGGNSGREEAAEAPKPKEPEPPRGLGKLRITDVRAILTAPAGIRLVVVKVTTSEPGLYGLGCATFTQRARVVETAVDKYLRPFLLGKDPSQIEDIWQSAFVSSYWRNGPVLGNALSGVDMAQIGRAHV